MGIHNHKARETIKKHSVRTTLTKLSCDFEQNIGRKPVTGVDISVWIQSALKNTNSHRVSEQFHLIPRVAVTAVSEYVLRKAKAYRDKGFDLIFVFDGSRNPLKAKENANRNNNMVLSELEAKLLKYYSEPNKRTLKEVDRLRKLTIWDRPDVYGEVLKDLNQNGFPSIGAPFEADHQFVSLQNQQVIDFVISSDTDFPFLGIERTIYHIASNDNTCDIYYYSDLCKNLFPTIFECDKECITPHTIALFSCLLGNDYIDNISGMGYVLCKDFMKKYLAAKTEEERFRHITQLSHPSPKLFDQVQFFLKHAPAYYIIPKTDDKGTDTDSTAVNFREAFLQQSYTIELRSMTGKSESNKSEFYLVQNANDNLRMGFDPHQELKFRNSVQHWEYFTLNKWSRTGLVLPVIANPKNMQNESVFPGSIIDFLQVPVKFVSTKLLEIWLSSRGVPIDRNWTRDEIEVKVNRMRDYNLDALPICCFRGGGGYVDWVTLEPSESLERAVIWLRGDPALEILRSYVITHNSKNFVEDILEEANNSKRLRCLKHIKSGSLDIKGLKITTDMVSPMHPGKKLLVIQAHCAPSQKLGSPMYSVKLVFTIEANNTIVPVQFPLSYCDCPVGVSVCAHKGAFILLLYLLQFPFKELTFDEVVTRLPSDIFTIASQAVTTQFRYPLPGSDEAKLSARIRKGSIRLLGYRTHTVDNEELLEGEEESDGESDFEDSDIISSPATGIDESNDTDNDDTGSVQSSQSQLSSDSSFDPAEYDDDNNDDSDDDESYLNGLLNVSKTDLVKEMDEWAAQLELSLKETGHAQLYDVSKIEQSTIAAASMDTDPVSIRIQEIRFHRMNRSVTQQKLPRQLYSYYAKQFVDAGGGCVDDIDQLSGLLELPNEFDVYPPKKKKKLCK